MTTSKLKHAYLTGGAVSRRLRYVVWQRVAGIVHLERQPLPAESVGIKLRRLP